MGESRTPAVREKNVAGRPASITIMRKLMQFSVLCILTAALVVLLTVGISAVSEWIGKVGRPTHHAIVPRMWPFFCDFNVSQVDGYHEKHYGVRRYIDYSLENYVVSNVVTPPHHCPLVDHVPVLYVHGNAGSFFDARTYGHFVALRNIRKKRMQMNQYETLWKRRMFAELMEDGLITQSSAPHHARSSENAMNSNSSSTQRVNLHFTPKATEANVRASMMRGRNSLHMDRMSLLSLGVYGVDFLEESNIQSGAIMVKQARYVNHTIHALLDRFRHFYKDVLSSPEPSGAEGADDTALNNAASVQYVRREYEQALCSVFNPEVPLDPRACENARRLLPQLPMGRMVKRTVDQVSKNGLWIIAESMGGVVSFLAAVLAGEKCAGVVIAGGPLRYSPFMFDSLLMHVHEVIHKALLMDPEEEREKEDNEEARIGNDPGAVSASSFSFLSVSSSLSAKQFINSLNAMPNAVLRERVSHTHVITVTGGALDDVISPLSSQVTRSTHRARGSKTLTTDTCVANGYRRDVCSEELRGCGTPLDHGALVYAKQLQGTLADSLLNAALLPHAERFLGSEISFPTTVAACEQERVFPMIVESISENALQFRDGSDLLVEAVEFHQDRGLPSRNREDDETATSTLQSTVTSSFADVGVAVINFTNGNEKLRGARKTLCTPLLSEQQQLPLDLSHIFGSKKETCASEELRVLVGYTTYRPEEVLSPRMHLYVSKDATAQVAVAKGVEAVVSSILHLPNERRTGFPQEGELPLTLVSFTVRKRPAAEEGEEGGRSESAQHLFVWPQFCFEVENSIAAPAHQLFVQHHAVCPLSTAEREDAVAKEHMLEPQPLSPAQMLVERLLSYVPLIRDMKRVFVDHRQHHTLLYNLDIFSMETKISVSLRDRRAQRRTMAPYVICGSLSSFRLALEGMHGLSHDDPESQLQYNFGPYDPGVIGRGVFNYSWKPFVTLPFNQSEPYMILVLAGVSQVGNNVRIQLDTLEKEAHPDWSSPRYYLWFLHYRMLRLCAYFSVFSFATCAAYLHLFFVMYVVCGGTAVCTAMRHSHHHEQSVSSSSEPVLKPTFVSMLSPWMDDIYMRVRSRPVVRSVLLSTIVELGSAELVRWVVSTCQGRDHIFDALDCSCAELDGFRRVLLVALMGFSPSGEECQYSWIRNFSVTPEGTPLVHVLHVMGGGILMILVISLCRLISVVGRLMCRTFYAVLRLLARCICLRRVSHISAHTQHRLLSFFMFAMWALPFILYFFVPVVHLTVTINVAVVVGLVALCHVPFRFHKNPEVRSTIRSVIQLAVYAMMCAHLASHVAGFALTLRNYFLVPFHALVDHDRNAMDPLARASFFIIQLCSAAALFTFHHFGLYSQDGNVGEGLLQRLGKWNSEHTTFRAMARCVRAIALLISLWSSIISLRRPLESSVFLASNMGMLLAIASTFSLLW